MPAVLSAVSSLAQVLAGLGLVGTLFKPIPPLVDSLQSTLGPTVNPILAPLGISLIETSDFNSTSSSAISGASTNTNTTGPSAPSTDASCIVEPYEVPPPTQFTFPPYRKADAELYRYRQQQSVNLGGWFALESWMTPSIFTCAGGNKTSELDFAMGWGSSEAARMVIERHWDTFVTERDFAAMASMGINTVRMPIGYWSLGPAFLQGTPFEAYASVYANAWARVVRAINAAGKYNIGVLVDLHGAPGSQNALPSAGVSDGAASLFTNTANVQKTVAVLSFLTQQLGPVSNVVGVQILNEPTADPALETFYNTTIATLRALAPQAVSMPYYIHDSFDLGRFSSFVEGRTDFVVLDHHSYFIFSPKDAEESASNHTADIQTDVTSALLDASTATNRNMIIGEFSCALQENSLAPETNVDDARRAFCTTQMETYQNLTSGWHFWSWTEEGCNNDPNWCFQSAVGKSLPAAFSSYDGGASARNGSGSAGRPSAPVSTLADPLMAAIKAMVPPKTADQLQNVYNGTLSDVDSVGSLPVSPSSGNETVSSTANSLGLLRRLLGSEAHAPRSHARSFQQLSKRSPSSSERAISLGYSEGFETGRSFAASNLSKLGFRNQFMEDKLADHVLNKEVDSTQADVYRKWFVTGLTDAEALVSEAIAAQSASGGDGSTPAESS